MKVPARARQMGLSTQMTPLIDIVFLLNIFFLVSSFFVRNQNQTEIELPSASQGRDLDDADARLTITIDAAGQLYLGEAPIDPIAFEQHLLALKLESPDRPLELRLRGDRRTNFEKIEPLLVTAAKQNISKIRFAVLPEGGGEASGSP